MTMNRIIKPELLQDMSDRYYFTINKTEQTNECDPLASPNFYFLNNNKKYYSSNSDMDVRKDFPIFQRKVNGKPLIWLDNSATTQKPSSVIDALSHYYKEYNSNVHRGAHTLAALATEHYEEARRKVQQFLHASMSEEVIFVRGATEAINLVAETYGKANISKDDEILLTRMEHHSNIVPWQKLQEETGAVIKVIPMNDQGDIIMEEYEKLLTKKTRIVAITHVSNTLGTINPVRAMIQMAHGVGAVALIDGAQAAPHLSVNVQELDADFYVFSGHKAYGPTGIGALYGKRALLEKMPPWQRGGGMIKNVSFDKTEYNKLPEKFEAGTGNIAGAVGLNKAIDYINKIGINNIENHERALTAYAMKNLSALPGLNLIGTSDNKISVLSFIINNVSPEKVAYYLDQHGIATRSGHHCAQPTLEKYGLTSVNRVSLGMYNTREDIDTLIEILDKIIKIYS